MRYLQSIIAVNKDPSLAEKDLINYQSQRTELGIRMQAYEDRRQEYYESQADYILAIRKAINDDRIFFVNMPLVLAASETREELAEAFAHSLLQDA